VLLTSSQDMVAKEHLLTVTSMQSSELGHVMLTF